MWKASDSIATCNPTIFNVLLKLKCCFIQDSSINERKKKRCLALHSMHTFIDLAWISTDLQIILVILNAYRNEKFGHFLTYWGAVIFLLWHHFYLKGVTGRNFNHTKAWSQTTSTEFCGFIGTSTVVIWHHSLHWNNGTFGCFFFEHWNVLCGLIGAQEVYYVIAVSTYHVPMSHTSKFNRYSSLSATKALFSVKFIHTFSMKMTLKTFFCVLKDAHFLKQCKLFF